jgi:hypothetical protein
MFSEMFKKLQEGCLKAMRDTTTLREVLSLQVIKDLQADDDKVIVVNQ